MVQSLGVTAESRLPQLDADIFLSDGGIETTLIYLEGIDLPDFAAFVLLDDDAGRAAIVRYFESYAELAVRDGIGIVLETPTWRASLDWGAKLGYSDADLARINRDAVALVQDIRAKYATEDVPIVVSGCIGPRGDGYAPESLMTREEAREYHTFQARAFADAGADLITAITMTNTAEALGIADAARAVELPVVLSFTVETTGVLPSGESLGAAIEHVDAATGAYPSYYMINCAHPTHFADVLDDAQSWARRVRGIRANASRMSHAELDNAVELDRGDPDELAAQYRDVRDTHPQLTVLGGCCGTDNEHISAISAACALR
jgi:S-methylmethionine-dependent homocysteine/selenocysteine methylase